VNSRTADDQASIACALWAESGNWKAAHTKARTAP